MKAEQISLGVSAITETVYAGRLNKAKTMWLEKKDVTDMFIHCAIQKFGGHITEMESEDGKKYEITVKEVKEFESEKTIPESPTPSLREGYTEVLFISDEEIENAANEIYPLTYGTMGSGDKFRNASFVTGAKWAIGKLYTPEKKDENIIK